MRYSIAQVLTRVVLVSLYVVLLAWIVYDEIKLSSMPSLEEENSRLQKQVIKLYTSSKNAEYTVFELYGMVTVLKNYIAIDKSEMNEYYSAIKIAVNDLKRYSDDDILDDIEAQECLNRLAINE